MDITFNFGGKVSFDLNIHIRADVLAAAIRDAITAISLNTWSNTAMSQELDDLTAQVHTNTAVQASALVLIRGIAARVAAAAEDPAALRALSAELASSDTDLAAAVAANTVADPAPPSAQEPAPVV